MSKKNKIIIRADGGSAIGMGHIMRCIGLAQELRNNNFDVIFALSTFEQSVIGRLEYERFEFRCLNVELATLNDSAMTLNLCCEMAAVLVICDGYNFNTAWLQALSSRGHKLMLWTDFLQDENLPVDILLDQTPQADERIYREACPNGKILCGLKYAVLRSEFVENMSLRRSRETLNNILVTMGGSDPTGATFQVLSSIYKLPYSVNIRVVIGPAMMKRNEIIFFAEKLDNCEVYESVKDMSLLFDWADIAISAAGATLWEFAYSGLPAIVTYVAENQKPLAEALDVFGGGINLGAIEDVSNEDIHNSLSMLLDDNARLHEMSKNMLSQVDGQGVKRVTSLISSELSC